MEITEIKVLYDKLYSDNLTQSPKHFIDLYEENKNLIEGADSSTSNPDYNGILRITSDYALSLSHYGSSQKALQYLDKAIQMFKASSSGDLTKVPLYEMLIWTRGMENYYQKIYATATNDFEYLVKNFPDNDKYRNWLAASKTIPLKKYLNIFWAIAGASLILNLVFDKEVKLVEDITLYTGPIAFGLALIVEIVIYKIRKKIKGQSPET